MAAASLAAAAASVAAAAASVAAAAASVPTGFGIPNWWGTLPVL